MAARVFKLDELATRIVTHLFAISPESTVALALTCRALEVPALSALWEKQDSISRLIERVLSTDVWCLAFPPHTDLCLLALQRPLTTWELNRLKRYTSWMRRLDMGEWGLSEEITRLVLPPSDGTPAILPLHLRELNCWLNETNLFFLPKFLSSNLTKIVISTDTFVRPGAAVRPWGRDLPDEVVPVMRSAIKMFPSSLRILRIQVGVGPETHLTEEISKFVLRCGESLRELNANLVLSTQAIVHLMKLPNLREWNTWQGPPRMVDLIRNGVPNGAISLFPSLEVLSLRGEAALEWLSLFEIAKSRTPWIMAGNNLPIITYRHPTLPIDSSLVSKFLPFASLIDITIVMGCFFRPCASKFTDQDMERLATALPKLETLTLGERPCGADTCPTTIRSLLSLSIHCMKLKFLNIHFRTEDLRADMLDLLGYAYSQGLHSRPKCALETLVVGETRIELSDYDPALISMGMLMIFPSLTRLVSRSPEWARLELLVKALGHDEKLSIVTELLMKRLADVPASSAGEVARIICKPLSVV